MQNINYDLVKLLHVKLDSIWRLENHYIKDAKTANCKSLPALEKVLQEDKKHAQMITQAIKERMDEGVFE